MAAGYPRASVAPDAEYHIYGSWSIGGDVVRKLIGLAVMAVAWGLAGSCQAADIYQGLYYTFEKAETYNSIFVGKVYLLEPAGFDYLPTDWAPPAILITGEISAEAVGVLRRLIAANPKADTVYFDSPGGDLFAGMLMGVLIHDHGLDTAVNGNAECESACALAFLGGAHRSVFTDTHRFGFHRQYYIKGNKIRYGSWAHDVAQIRAYLNRIHSTTITAEEVVGTTELVTYSEDRMKARGFTTQDSADIAVRGDHWMHDPSPSEKYMVACWWAQVKVHDGPDYYRCRLDPLAYLPFRTRSAMYTMIWHMPDRYDKTSHFQWSDMDRIMKAYAVEVERRDPGLTDPGGFFKLDCESWGVDGFRDFLDERVANMKYMTPDGSSPQYDTSDLLRRCTDLIGSDPYPLPHF